MSESYDPPCDIELFAGALPPGAPILGLDLGTKTIGVAASDMTRTIANGVETIRRKKFRQDAERLLEIAAERSAVGFVVGFPVNLNGSEGPRAQSARAFVRNLGRETALPILLWDERLSTVAAERALLEADTSRARRGELIDKLAATIILQGALDRLANLARTAAR